MRLFLKGDVLYFFTRGRAKLKSKERPRPAAATIPGLGTVRAAWLPVLITYFAFIALVVWLLLDLRGASLMPVEFVETFELAAPGKELEVYSRNHFRRAAP